MTTLPQTNRQLKVAELIRLTLIELLKKGKAKDHRLFEANITITKVIVSGDLQIANCYVLPFNSALSKDELIDALDKSKYGLRTLVAQKVNLRYAPELRFFFDHAMQNVHDIETILQNSKS